MQSLFLRSVVIVASLIMREDADQFRLNVVLSNCLTASSVACVDAAE